jgi:hypothetical protein
LRFAWPFAGCRWQVMYHNLLFFRVRQSYGLQPDHSMHSQPSLFQEFFTRQNLDGEALNGA